MPSDVPFIERLYNLLECLKFNGVGLTADGEQVIYEHPERNRGFSNRNRIYLPLTRVTDFNLGRKVLDDLLNEFRFPQQEIAGCCEGLEILKLAK